MPFDKTIMFHRWLGNFLVFESFIHLCYYAGKQDLYPDVYGTGVGAFVFLIFIALTSIGYIRRKYFNWFYASHFTFIAFYLLACLHSKKSVVPFTYAALFFYLLDRVLRLFWGAWPSKAVKMQIVNNAVQITFKKHFAAKYKVGQYVFLNFPQIALMEWHPFTLANGPDEEHLEVLIKGLGDHTKKLIEKAQSPFSDLWIRVDGPYGKWPYNFARYRAVALFAGGIGVTPSMALIRHVFHINRPESAAASEQSALKDVFFIWSCKSKREFDWYSQMLIEAMKRSASSAQYPSLHVILFNFSEISKS
jgi:predicted ferric reductase